jgi:tetratricopeptide (TPR) repeat protein
MKRIQHSLVVVCALIVSFGAHSQIETDSITSALDSNSHVKFQEHFYEALKHKALENYSRAIEELLLCIEIDASESAIFFELGTNYFKHEQFQKAESNFKKAISLNEANFWYKESLYHLYVEQARYDDAIEAVQPLLSRSSDYRQDLANLYINVGNYNEALNVLDKLDANLGISSIRDKIRAEVYTLSGDEDKRIAHLNTRLLESPETPSNFLNLIVAYSNMNKKQEAFETAQAFLLQHPKSHLVHVALYKFYLDSEDFDKAIESMKIVTTSTVVEPSIKVKVLNDFMQFVAKFPEYQSALIEVSNAVSQKAPTRSDLELANYYYTKKDYQKAIPYYQKALEFDPNNFSVIKNLALLYLETTQFDLASSFTNQQIDFFPSQPVLYLVNGTANRQLNKLELAMDYLMMGLDYVIDNKELQRDFYKELSTTYRLQGNIKESEAFTNKAIELEKKP